MKKVAGWIFLLVAVLALTSLTVEAAELVDPDTWLGEKEYRFEASILQNRYNENFPEIPDTDSRTYSTLRLGFDYGLSATTNFYTALYFTPQWNWDGGTFKYGPETTLHLGIDHLISKNFMLWGYVRTTSDQGIRPPTGDAYPDYNYTETEFAAGITYLGKFQ